MIIEAPIFFIIIFSLGYLCYQDTGTNKADIWVHSGMRFCTEMWQKERGKKIMMLVRVFWCDMPWDLNWVWGRWRKERAGQVGNGGRAEKI